jgi:hypothetical protein
LKEAPESEQKLCVECGFCCDRTLFDVARVYDDEKLWGVFEERETEVKGQRYFKLPCPHFDTKCTIYDQNKPRICSSFRCKLLKDVEANEVTSGEALQIIEQVKTQRDDLMNSWLGHGFEKSTFREVYYKSVRDEEENVPDEIKFKANLLEIQLTKYFKSKETFDKFYELME